ncbi:MAG: GAF domain-containing protein [Desulfobacterales bacterium]|nr:GAF domain-containing protein [Desulfobacterales bacterium]
MKNKTDYFKTICKISKALGTAAKKDELLDIIVQSAIDAMDGKAACLFLGDEKSEFFVPVAQKGLSENYLHTAPTDAKQIVADILQEGGHISIRDATKDPRTDNHDVKKAEGIASILVLPVMVNNEAIGVLSLYTPEPRDFSQDEIDFLAAMAEQGGMAIQQARLMEQINKNSRLFVDLASNMNSSWDIRKIFHVMSADIGESLGIKGVSVRLLNPETKIMDLVASYGLSEEYLNAVPVSAEENEIVKLILKGETVAVRNVAEDKRIRYKKEAEKEGIVSVLSVPIKTRGKVIGDLKLSCGTERNFSGNTIEFFSAIAHQGGIAIENAQLVSRMRMNTEFFHDLAVNINSTLDVKSILHIMSADVAEFLGVKAVSIRLLDEEKGTLELVSSYGLSEKYLSKGPLAVEKGISEALKNRPVVVKNVATDSGVQYPKEKQEEGIVSILSVPINARDDVIGVMRLYSDVPRAFTEDDIMMAVAMAHQGGLAIQNASMYLRLQEDKKDLEEEIWSHKSWF